MGRGDRKTRKGTIAIRSYGNSRPHDAVQDHTGEAVRPASRPAAARPPVKKAAAPRKAPAKRA
jgi:ribosomal small subunit protein bTHX